LELVINHFLRISEERTTEARKRSDEQVLCFRA
jgi:hypothetical protein